jgi:transmembrane sensor
MNRPRELRIGLRDHPDPGSTKITFAETMSHSLNLIRKPAIRAHLRRAVSILVYVLAGLGWKTATAPIAPVYQTAIGQHTAITLKDRSEVHLGGATSIVVNDTSGLSTIHLQRGEIFTEVRHNADRPFEVVANHLIAFDLGTAYDMSTHDSTSSIAVLDGQVRLLERNDWGQRFDPITVESGVEQRVPVILGPGDSARAEQLDNGTIMVTRGPTSLAIARQSTEWLQGGMVANTRRLDDIVWQFNRYNHTPIVIDHPEVGVNPLGMVAFRLGDIKGFIDALRLEYDVEFVAGTGDQSASYHVRGQRSAPEQIARAQGRRR